MRRDPRTDVFEQAALKFLARCDRTEAQLCGFLTRRRAPPSKVRTLVRRFVARGYLNDEVYAARWARARLARKPMARARLDMELRRRGVTPSTVDRTLDELFEGRLEVMLAREFLARRGAKNRGLESKAQAAMLLRRHGFEDDTIEAVLNDERRTESGL